ncbi:MAG: Rne/Rng family ribonuclease [Chthonomonadetes bacterium]|nr:Rne/Rng family ribonuclease [Chthonomonadetes bacterium]
MKKEIIVNVGSRETRIAVLEDDRLMELHVEREERIVGSIYKARVANVLPGMDAAFVDIGLERNAFLYVGDILPESGEETPAPASMRRSALRNRNIKEILRVGQEILVQVTKGPRGTKGSRVTTRITLPGRYVVLAPEGEHLGVSRKISDPKERERLRKLGRELRPEGFGLIIRTEAEDKSEEQLVQDIEWLLEQWRCIQETARKAKAPALIHKDYTLLYKTVRDIFGSDTTRMVIDDPEEFQQAVELASRFAPKLRSRIELYDKEEPIFDHFRLEQEIDRLMKRQVFLKSGGYLTIDETEALTTIDVNTGKFTGSTSLADTILRTNIEAAEEVARQLRLRDLGGIIVIDFIDMTSAHDRQQVMRTLERALKRDRARTKISHISPLGLVQMTRKRTGESVVELLMEPCPYCGGRGRIIAPESVSMDIERELSRRAVAEGAEAYLVIAHPKVAEILIGPEGENVDELEHTLHCAIYVRSDPDRHIEHFDIRAGTMSDFDRLWLGYRRAQVVECTVEPSSLSANGDARFIGWADGFLLDLTDGAEYAGQRVKVRLLDVRRSFAFAEVIPSVRPLDRSEIP